MKKLINISLCLILSLNFGYSQSIKRSVLCSFGSSSSSTNLIVASTFAQPSNIGTLTNGNNYLRQGFQQPINNNLIIYGCTDSLACNYNPNANVNDSTCVPAIYGCTDTNAFNYDWNATCDDGSCIPVILGCTISASINYNPNANIDDGSCIAIVYGCTDTTAFNYDPLANTDNGSCLAVVYGCTDPLALNYFAGANLPDPNNPCCYVMGCTDPNACNYDPNSCFDDGSCINISGCTDPTASNYDPNACVDDGSCIINTVCSNPTPTGLHAIDIIHNRARIKWDNMTSVNCTPEQYRVQYRIQGTSTWSVKNAVNTNNCGTFNQTGRLLTNLNPGTTYEYRLKAWYCYTSGASIWSSIETFTTLDACPNVGNFAVSTPLTTRAVFTWDDSNGPYSFVRIKLRVDSISNPSGSDWQNAGGFGVNYGTWSRNKNGLVAGEAYRGQSRTWCDPQGGPYKSSGWTPLIFWTQPTIIKIEGEYNISALNIYPNPSRDIFNISFISDQQQSFTVTIVNILGEMLIREDLIEFIGEYKRAINLNQYEKGVYILEIVTEDGTINKKLILQ